MLDGRNRLRACELAGVEPLFVTRTDIESPTTFVLSLNLYRRHLTPAQRAALGVDVSKSFAADARARQSAAGGDRKSEAMSGSLSTDSVLSDSAPAPKQDPDARALTQAAKAVGAGREATERMAAVQRDAPEVFAAVKSGAIERVTDAKRIAAMPAEQRAEVLVRVASGEEPRRATLGPTGPQWWAE